MLHTRTREDGQASIELLGLTPILLLVALGVLQALMFGHAAVAAEQAARTGARVAMTADDQATVQGAVRTALPSSLRSDATTSFPGGSLERVQVEVRVPTVLPARVSPDFRIRRTVEMPEVARWG